MAGILIIDDDSDDAEFLADAFKDCGLHNVHHVSNATEAFQYLEGIKHTEGLPKVVITDNILPGKTGTEFIAELKQMDKYSSIPVILLSTTRRESDIERYKLMGAMEFIIKPTRLDEYSKVASYIQNKLGEL